MCILLKYCGFFFVCVFQQFCEDEGVPVHSIMTHLVDSWADLDLSRRQLDIFQKAVYEYRLVERATEWTVVPENVKFKLV